jgi:transposase
MTRTIDVSLEGLHGLYERIGNRQLEDGDWPLVGALVGKLINREQGKVDRMIAKIAAEAAANAETTTNKPDTGNTSEDEHRDNHTAANTNQGGESGDSLEASNSTGSAVDSSATDKETNDKKPTDDEKPKGHGRNGASAYTNAKHVFHTLLLGIIGRLCECKDAYMTRYREKVVIRIIGQPLFGAEIHHFEQARCKMCGLIIRATGPATVLEGLGTSYVTYAWSACAMLIVMHYFGGAPFKRLEMLHAGWGTPLADANQWSIVDQSDDHLQPLYKAIEVYGMREALNLRIDDTGSMIIELMRQIKAEIEALKLLGESTDDVRQGINTTGVYLETPNGTVILFFTGLHHAGEILNALLKHRQPEGPKLVKVTDAASKNFNPQHRDRLIEGVCNAHAFLKFHDIKDKFPEEYAVAAAVYKQVFDNDDIAKARNMTPTERMIFHRENSLPLMEKLKAMCEAKMTNRLVEPNSKLWEPIIFIINQWPRLTKFCEESGVPLDSNLVEQCLIMPVRYLAGSRNFKTSTGAEVGDRQMSLIASARINRVEPVGYLEHCLKNHEDLKKRPEYYLPWVYRERMEAQARDGPSEMSSDVPQEQQLRQPGP